jgi:D-xylose 1-dehydrogenase (NADP+, D-xylono-1,5-lactone-forming)
MMRWGLLSTANINRAILEGARRTDEATVVAVASRDRSRAESYAREHGLERAHGSYEALLEDPEVDAVYVSLPNSLHVPWAVRALEAGKHVLCEKPLTRRPAEAEEAFAAAERADRLLAEAFMWRHHPQARRLEALLEEGRIGRLRVVRATFSFSLRRDGDVRMAADLDGGSLMDVGCYCVSGIRLVSGSEPERVHGEQVLGPEGVDVAFSATLRLPDDVLGQFDCGFVLSAREGLEAVGEDGSLFLDNPWKGRAPVIEVRRAGEIEEIAVEAADPYACELADFAAAARGDAPARFGASDALAQARAIEALYASAESGAAVAL